MIRPGDTFYHTTGNVFEVVSFTPSKVIVRGVGHVGSDGQWHGSRGPWSHAWAGDAYDYLLSIGGAVLIFPAPVPAGHAEEDPERFDGLS